MLPDRNSHDTRSTCGDIEVIGNAFGKVHNASPDIGSAVGNGCQDALSVFGVHDTDLGTERKPAMCDRVAVHIVLVAVGHLSAVESGAVPRGGAALIMQSAGTCAQVAVMSKRGSYGVTPLI